MSECHEVICEVVNRVGVITLNRQDRYNALSLPMIRTIDSQLEQWATDDQVALVVIRSNSDAFCAGADMASFYDALSDPDPTLMRDYFREEYILNHHIYQYPKPYISMLNGRVRGDGIGLSFYGSHRIVTEQAEIILSETDIGFIIDGGATWFLSRFPGRVGWHIGLSGVALQAADALYTGLGTHYIPSDKLTELEQRLAKLPGDNIESEIDTVLNDMHEECGASSFETYQESIDRVYNAESIEEILCRLARRDEPWKEETLEQMLQRSPTALKAVLRLITAGRRLDFVQSLELEYRVSQNVMRNHDFREGIRARIIERDNNPRWHPDLPEAVSTAMIDNFFMPLPEGEMRFKWKK